MQKSTSIHPVILSGGSGTRLWPLSRAALPKQLLSLTSQRTMLQDTIQRAAVVPGARQPLLVCNEAHRFIIKEQLQEINCDPAGIILEPFGKNTAPAIALAALHLIEKNTDAVMLILPADHIIDDRDAFAKAAVKAASIAEQGYLVTFGIVPSEPETGYGYIETGAPISKSSDLLEEDDRSCYLVRSFTEKPDSDKAQRYIDSGKYLWNSGMFVFKAEKYLQELQAYRPDILEEAKKAWASRSDDIEFHRIDAAAFNDCPSESIDYAVMQHTSVAAVIPSNFGWNDVGNWSSLWEVGKKNQEGNVTRGDVFLCNTENSYVRSEHRHVSVVGMSDVVVVETADAVLVIHKSKAQDVKECVQFLANSKRKEHLEHIKVYRPWGWYEGIDHGERFQVKRIMVRPGAKLSLQMHHHRAEHWIVVSGTALVTVGEKTMYLGENQSTYIPTTQLHRLENPGKIDLEIVEVQSGAYLGEDDIVRFEDNYGRAK